MHSLSDLVLDSSRCSGHQLVRPPVEAQDGSCIDIEDHPHTSEQLDEQVVDVKLRECAVGQRLEVLQALRDRDIIRDLRRLAR